MKKERAEMEAAIATRSGFVLKALKAQLAPLPEPIVPVERTQNADLRNASDLEQLQVRRQEYIHDTKYDDTG